MNTKTQQKKLDDDLLFFANLNKKSNNKRDGAIQVRKMRDQRANDILSNRIVRGIQAR